jgi:hypothetical protein
MRLFAQLFLVLPIVTVAATSSIMVGAQVAKPAQKAKVGKGFSLGNLPIDTLESSLKLTPAQKTKITAIQAKMEADLTALGNPKDPEKRGAARKITSAANTAITAELNPAQQQQAAKLGPEVYALKAAGMPKELAGKITLTTEQEEKIEAIAQELKVKVKALPEQDRKAQSKALKQEAELKMAAVLTKPQQDMLKQYADQHPQGKKKKAKP